MTAVTADTLTLPRIAGPTAADTDRPVRSVTTGPRGYEGEGFPVVRAFAGASKTDLDPFVHMDQMGEVEYQPGEPRGTNWHPHRGFETVTYMIDGRFQHQDSHGGGGLISDGATQWMTAGSGILHIETPPAELVESGGMFHGVQLWVNLPAAEKMTDPAYQSIEGKQATLLSSADGGALVRIIAGDIDGHRRPGLDPHTDHVGARHHRARCRARPAVEPRLQRPGVRLVRTWHRRPGRQPDPAGPTGRPRTRRPDLHLGSSTSGFESASARGATARRASDPGTGVPVRTVRDEHQGTADRGDGRLQRRQVRSDTARRADAAHVGQSTELTT